MRQSNRTTVLTLVVFCGLLTILALTPTHYLSQARLLSPAHAATQENISLVDILTDLSILEESTQLQVSDPTLAAHLQERLTYTRSAIDRAGDETNRRLIRAAYQDALKALRGYIKLLRKGIDAQQIDYIMANLLIDQAQPLIQDLIAYKNHELGENNPPIANAGPDQSVANGDWVSLDGSASSDRDGDPLSYSWSLQDPAGQPTGIDDPSLVNPGFQVQSEGDYLASLTVNDGQQDSEPDSVILTTLNAPPVADAGPDKYASEGQTVIFDGAGSSDINGDTLSYHWNLIEQPTGSQTQLSAPQGVTPSLTLDLPGDYKAQLIVNDGQFDSQPDTTLASTVNNPPVANAGPDQGFGLNSTAQLDGSGSSDPDGDQLTFRWSLLSAPTGSQAQISNASAISPTIQLDLPGDYQVQLIVNDGVSDSVPDTILLTSRNSRPTADAGIDRTLLLGAVALLDASQSSDPDGQPLSYQWDLLNAPAGSSNQLQDTQQPQASLYIDQPGDYQTQLVVSDGELQSVPDIVTYSTINSAPVADAGPNRSVYTSESLTLDGSGSSDYDDDPLSYLWSLLVKPSGSQTQLNNDQAAQAHLTPDLEGDYLIQLVVSDGSKDSEPDSLSLSASVRLNRPPQINSTPPTDAQVYGHYQYQIQASDPDNDPISYQLIDGPTDMTISPDGLIQWVPPTQGAISVAIRVSDPAGFSDSQSYSISVGPGDGLPPEPEWIAPEISETQNPNLRDQISFLYDSATPIQTGVDPLTIDAERVAVLRGRVLDRNNQPLSGAVISIHNHPEYGQTISRASGEYDLAVNGGGQLTLNISKAGYLPAQRKARVPWRDYVSIDDLVLVTLDPQVTSIDLSATSQAFQVAQGTVSSDVDGQRQATILFPAGTSATMTLADGSIQPLTQISVRATEYTVGENGPEAMPAPLPPTSGYTYAIELSLDEAIAANASRVDFSQPMPLYVDNFLNFPVGETVPLGYYDRDKAAWIPSSNGRIINVLSITNGSAELDIDGSGVAASATQLNDLGITQAEQQQLASLYQVGKSLWRVQVTHFTPWDCNWPYGPPQDATGHTTDNVTTEAENQSDKPVECAGCIIEAENQILGERIALTGTPFSLNYRSSRSQGNKSAYTLKIPLSGDSLSPDLKAIDLTISIAGRTIKQRHPATANQTVNWVWDGLDAFGRVMTDGLATIQVDYVYPVVYYAARSDFEASFAIPGAGEGGGLRVIGTRGSQEVIISRTWQNRLGDYRAEQASLGLWSLSPHHAYDLDNQTLYRGDGTHRSASLLPSIVETVAGNGLNGFTGDGGPAVEASLRSTEGIAIGPDGALYIADSTNYRVRKVDSDGIITTFAGNGQKGFSGDGGLAVDASLYPRDLAVGPDGAIYIADYGNARIRKVDTNGIITTVVGNGLEVYSGDGTPALEASIKPTGIAVGSEGELYIIDTDSYIYSRSVRKVGTDGIISTVAGNGQNGYSGDGGPAIDASLNYAISVAIGPAGELYISDLANSQIRKVGTDGIITTVVMDTSLYIPHGVAVGPEGEIYIADYFNIRVVKVDVDGHATTIAGTGQAGYSGDGGAALKASFQRPDEVAIGPNGEIYIADLDNDRIRRVRQPMPGFSITDLLIPSEDGQQLFHFTDTGRHLQTLDATTQAVLYDFGYDTEGRLTSITDLDGDVTQIQRDGDGNPLAIIAHDGQTTQLSLDSNGYLASITEPTGASHQMTYTADGLLTGYSDPNGNPYQYNYGPLGRLIQDINPVSGGWTLSRTDQADGKGYTITMTSGEGYSSTYHVETLPTGDRQRTTTAPDGSISTVLTKLNGTSITTAADGSVTTRKEGPDPRFGMQSPVTEQQTLTLPSGLTTSITNSRTATLTDPNDPLSDSQLTETTSLNGKTSSSVYDSTSRTWSSTSAGGRTASVQIDAKGRPINSQTTGLAGISYSYDLRGRLTQLSQVDGTDSRITDLVYDSAGYLQSMTDALDRTTSFLHDQNGRITQQTLPGLRQIHYQYDPSGNLSVLSPPGRPDHSFRYNGMHDETQYQPPIAGILQPDTFYQYNKDRQLTLITRPDGNTANLSYHLTSGQLQGLSIPRGNYQYQYDTAGRIDQITAPDNSQLSYQYDGPLVTQSQWTDSLGATTGSVQQDYNNDLALSQRCLNNQHCIGFGYDNDQFLTQAGSLSLSRAIQQGGLITGTSLNSIHTSHQYNGFGEIGQYQAEHTTTATVLYTTDYQRDLLGRISQQTETINGTTATHSYQYDTAGRLTSHTRDGILLASYGYDENGNRTTLDGTTIASYDDQDRLLTYGTTNYSYTDNGELTQKTEGAATTSYSYDVLGNLTQVHLDPPLPPGEGGGEGIQQIDYQIDAQNRRIGKKVNGIQTQGFLYKDQLNPIAELDQDNNIVSRFIYADKANVPAYLIKIDPTTQAETTYRLISDHLGSPRLIIDAATGQITQEISYDVWGSILTDTNPGFQPFGFAGGIYDQDTKLVRFGARDYDPETGRWTSKDPIRFQGGDTNLYGYVINDPVNFIDPEGEQPQGGFWNNLIRAIGVATGLFGSPVDDVRPPPKPAGETREQAGRRERAKENHEKENKGGKLKMLGITGAIGLSCFIIGTNVFNPFCPPPPRPDMCEV